jgi:hypothetical protein
LPTITRSLLELWQDDSPLQLFNIVLWFDHLYLFDKELRPVSLEMLAEWWERLRAAADAFIGPGVGVPRSIPAASPPVPVSSVLERIEGVATPRSPWQSKNSAMISESAENQVWLITTIGPNFGMQECAQGEYG